MSKAFESWEKDAKRLIYWQTPWHTLMQGDFNDLPIHWFSGARTNACFNCIDRHLPNHANKTALIWQGNETKDVKLFSYQMLYESIGQMANVLKKLGVQKKDIVCIYLPMIPEAIIAMLACARIGAIHNVIFGGFAADALKNRINDSKAKWVITVNFSHRGNKITPFKEIIDNALEDCPSIEKVLVIKQSQMETPWNPQKDIWLHDIATQVNNICEIEWMDANDPLFILYTSGSTGKPKGIVHATGGYLVYVASTYQRVFLPKEHSIHWCTADLGWITGHSYLLYGPLLNGGTTLIYEGVPNYPDYSRFWQIIEKFKVSQFYTSPTALRSLRLQGDTWITPYNLNSLEVLGSVGEPINPAVWEWYYSTIGQRKCPIVNTWWQTETGGMMLSATAKDTKFEPGSVGKPLPGIEVLLDEESMLFIKKPWPGMMLGIYQDEDRFKKQYFDNPEKGYLTGDSCYQDSHGEYHVTGRLDDVIKVSGHRLGTEELESAFVAHHGICEAAVVGIPHDIKGECIVAFLIAFEDIIPNQSFEEEIILHLRQQIGPIATPQKVIWVRELPKTRSGKIMRRILKKIATAQYDDLGDTSTLTDPNVILDIMTAYKNGRT